MRKDGEQLPELLKTIKSSVNLEKTGNAIAKMRQTKSRSLFIQINEETEAAESMRAEVKRSFRYKREEDGVGLSN